MRPFVIKRKIQKGYREKWWLRAVTLVLVLAGAILLVYLVPKLADKPSPVNVETLPSKFAPASARSKLEELVLDNPLIDPSTETLLSYLGRSNEVVKLYLTNAHLADETVDMFTIEEKRDPPPTGDSQIYYIPMPGARPGRRTPDNNETCTTSLSVNLVPGAKPPNRIHFFQSDGPGSDQQRFLAMMADADLIINLATGPPPDNLYAAGCDKELRVGNWSRTNEEGPLRLSFVMTAGSKITFIIQPLDMKSRTWTEDERNTSFEFAQPLPVQAVQINPLASDGTVSPSPSPIRSARSVGALSPLRVNNLSVGSEDLQLNVLGNGLVESEDAPAGGLLEQAKDNFLIKTLILAVGAAFIGWWLRRVYRLFSGKPPA